MYTQDISKVFSLPANSELKGFLGFTYSLDGEYFVKTILANLGISQRKDLKKLDYFGIIAHYSSIRSSHRVIYDRITPYNHSKGSHVSFHPKLYILKYLQKGVYRARVILGSFNLSKTGLNNTYEYLLSVDGRLKSREKVTNNMGRFIKQVARNGGKMDIANLPENNEMEFISQPESRMYKKIFENIKQAKDIHVVSPFWDNACIKELIKGTEKYKVNLHFYCNTNQDAAAILKWSGKKKCKIYVSQHFVNINDNAQGEDYEIEASSQDDILGGSSRAFNHAKLVLIQYAGNTKPLLFVGSANFTAKGMGIGRTMNVECGALVRSNKINGIEQFITIKGKPTRGVPFYELSDPEALQSVGLSVAKEQGYALDDIIDSISLTKTVILKGKILIALKIDRKMLNSLIQRNHISKLSIMVDGMDCLRRNTISIQRELSDAQKGLKLTITINKTQYIRELPLTLNDEMVRQIDIAADNALVGDPDELFDIDYLEKWDDEDATGNALDDQTNVSTVGLYIKRFPFQSLMRVLFSKDKEALGVFCGRLSSYLSNERGESTFVKYYEMSRGNFLTLLRYIKHHISMNKSFTRDRSYKHDSRLLLSTLNRIIRHNNK